MARLRHEREGSERFKSFTYEELIKRDKRWSLNPTCPASLDTLKVSVPPAVKLAAASRARPAPDPSVIALEITEELEAALAQFAEIAADLKR